MAVARSGHTAVLLPHNGGVLLAGGTAAGTVVTATDVFVPAVFPDPYSWGMGSFAPTGALTAPRAFALAVRSATTASPTWPVAARRTPKRIDLPRSRRTRKTTRQVRLAVITGSGWQPGEAVTLTFQEDPAVHDDYSFPVTADAARQYLLGSVGARRTRLRTAVLPDGAGLGVACPDDVHRRMIHPPVNRWVIRRVAVRPLDLSSTTTMWTVHD